MFGADDGDASIGVALVALTRPGHGYKGGGCRR